MLPQDSVLPFLEQRDYLHGTTLYRQLRRLAPPAVGTCFRIFRQIRTNSVRITCLQKCSNPVARLDWFEDGESRTFAVEELPMCLPIERHSYNEGLVTAACHVDGHNVYLEGAPPFDCVTSAVPMFKVALKANSHSSDSGGQWMFTRLDCVATGTECEHIELRLILVRPRGVAKAEILVGGMLYANMYFSWVS